MPEPAQSKTVKYAGNSVGVGLGNAIAYFGLQYAEWRHGWKFGDPVVAMAMAGAITSAAMLEARVVFGAIGRGFMYVFDRVFPPKA
jgi:hypothetical protein